MTGVRCCQFSNMMNMRTCELGAEDGSSLQSHPGVPLRPPWSGAYNMPSPLSQSSSIFAVLFVSPNPRYPEQLCEIC